MLESVQDKLRSHDAVDLLCLLLHPLHLWSRCYCFSLLVETEGELENKDSSSEEITPTDLKEVGREENEESDEEKIGIKPDAGMDYKRPGKKWAPIPGVWRSAGVKFDN